MMVPLLEEGRPKEQRHGGMGAECTLKIMVPS